MPVLVVQKGHCNRTTGSTGTTGEQNYATAVADACVRLLHGRGGWTVRAILADSGSYSGDAFAAVHCDGSTNTTARGASTGYQSEQGRWFAEAWMNAYAARGWTGGFRPPNYTDALAGYYGVRNAINAGNPHAIIVECGFMTNAADKNLMTGPGGVDRVALAIGDALGIPVQEDDMDATQDQRLKTIETWLEENLNRTRSMHQHGYLAPPENATWSGDLRWLDDKLAPILGDVADLAVKLDALSAKLDAALGAGQELVPETSGELVTKLVPKVEGSR